MNGAGTRVRTGDLHLGKAIILFKNFLYIFQLLTETKPDQLLGLQVPEPNSSTITFLININQIGSAHLAKDVSADPLKQFKMYGN